MGRNAEEKLFMTQHSFGIQQAERTGGFLQRLSIQSQNDCCLSVDLTNRKFEGSTIRFSN